MACTCIPKKEKKKKNGKRNAPTPSVTLFSFAAGSLDQRFFPVYIVYYSLARLISIADKRTKKGKRCKKVERERKRERDERRILFRCCRGGISVRVKRGGCIIIQKDKLILLRCLQTNRTIRLIVSVTNEMRKWRKSVYMPVCVCVNEIFERKNKRRVMQRCEEKRRLRFNVRENARLFGDGIEAINYRDVVNCSIAKNEKVLRPWQRALREFFDDSNSPSSSDRDARELRNYYFGKQRIGDRWLISSSTKSRSGAML